MRFDREMSLSQSEIQARLHTGLTETETQPAFRRRELVGVARQVGRFLRKLTGSV